MRSFFELFQEKAMSCCSPTRSTRESTFEYPQEILSSHQNLPPRPHKPTRSPKYPNPTTNQLWTIKDFKRKKEKHLKRTPQKETNDPLHQLQQRFGAEERFAACRKAKRTAMVAFVTVPWQNEDHEDVLSVGEVGNLFVWPFWGANDAGKMSRCVSM